RQPFDQELFARGDARSQRLSTPSFGFLLYWVLGCLRDEKVCQCKRGILHDCSSPTFQGLVDMLILQLYHPRFKQLSGVEARSGDNDGSRDWRFSLRGCSGKKRRETHHNRREVTKPHGPVSRVSLALSLTLKVRSATLRA